MANLPSVSEVNQAKGSDLREMFKRVFKHEAPSKITNDELKRQVINKMKADAKAAQKAAAPANGHNDDANADDANAQYMATERAAQDAEKKGEWLTAALAWEQVAKMLSAGKGRELAMERAAVARINAKVPAEKAKGGSSGGASAAIDSDEVKAAKAKIAAEKAAAKEAEAAKKTAEKEAAKKAKADAAQAKEAASIAEKEAAKKAKADAAIAKAAEKEAAAAADKLAKEAAAQTKAAEREAKATALAAEKAAAKAKREADREAKKALKPTKKDQPFAHDPRVAHLVGKQIIHTTKSGVRYEIDVVADGFIYKGEHYPSLSSLGKFVNGGKSTNGFVHFGLTSVPRPEMKNVEAILIGFNGAAQATGGLIPNLQAIIDGDTAAAHAQHAKITAAIAKLEENAKALRLGCRLIEMKKGKPATA